MGGATGVDFNDNVEARFGTGNDLKIFHDGSDSRIEDRGTGNLILGSNGTGVEIRRKTDSADEAMVIANNNGSVDLYYDNSKKFETTSTGVDVTGDLIADSVNLVGTNTKMFASSNGDDIQFSFNGATKATLNNGGRFSAGDGNATTPAFRFYDDPDTGIFRSANNKIAFSTGGTERMGINGSGHFLPFASNTYDLGSSSLVWRNIYTSDFHMSNEGLDKGNDIDGTKGSWTFQEGEENLYLINNKNGKKYKFNLTEIE